MLYSSSGSTGWYPPYGNDRTRHYTTSIALFPPQVDLKEKYTISTIKEHISKSSQEARPEEEYELHFPP